VLGIPSEPVTRIVKGDGANVAGLYPVTRRRHVGRLRLSQDMGEAFATHESTHESNRVEDNLGVEIEFRTRGNVAEERQGNQRLDQLRPTMARARGVGNRVLPLGRAAGVSGSTNGGDGSGYCGSDSDSYCSTPLDTSLGRAE
jgi:hypothetical protein